MARQTDRLVRLIKRNRRGDRVDYYARYRDPDTGKIVDVNLARMGITTERDRRRFLREKGEQLGRRLLERELGVAQECPHVSIPDGRARFLERVRNTLRPATHAAYAAATKKFLVWSAGAGLRATREVGRGELSRFYDWLTSSGRAPSGVNSHLSAVKAMLTDWHRREFLAPELTLADAHGALPLVRVDRGRPAILDQAGIRALLEAGLAADATGRFMPSAPVLLTFLLAGLRFGELVGLTWPNVYVADPAPRLVVTASSTKKRCERDVDLGVTPGLKSLLGGLQRASSGDSRVFPRSRRSFETMRTRLIAEFGAPVFTFSKTHLGTPTLRATAASFLTSAPGIYGGASVFHAASRHGHRVEVAQAHYLNRVRVAPDAETLEAAMGIEDLVERQVLGEVESL